MQLYVDLKTTGAISKCEIIAETQEKREYITFLFVGNEVQVEKFCNTPIKPEEVTDFYNKYLNVDASKEIGPYYIAQLVFSRYFDMTSDSFVKAEEVK